jgi:hypothetical protein
MTCEEFEELSGAYALEAVTTAEREAAEAHLATCAKCTKLSQELRGTVSLLPLSVPQLKVPASLKERIMAAIRQENAGIPGQPSQRTPGIQPVQPIPTRQRRWNPRILVAAAVLMLCLLSGTLTWGISLNHQVASLQQQLAQASSNSPLSTKVLSYTVNSTNPAQRATGQLYYFAKQNVTVLVMRGLPQLQGIHVYQGWLLHLKGNNITGVTSIGLLNLANGTASLSFPGNVTGFDAAAISMEPGPLATPTAPKGTVVALGSLKHSS